MNCQIYCWDAEDKVLGISMGRPAQKRKKKRRVEREPVM
jgi:hypothetical protein